MTKEEFRALTEAGPVFLDGATGSNFRKAGMPVGISSEVWAIEHPDVVIALQSAYVEAGSQIVYAPTFCANRLSLRNFGLEDRLEELNREAVRISKEAVRGRAYVAGDMTTTGKLLAPKGDLEYNDLLDVYKEQADALSRAGADLIGIETMMAVDETMAALEAVTSVCDLPVICTLTLEADGRAMFGGSAEEAVETLQALGASAVGVNCSVGPDQLVSVIRSMKAVAEIPIIAKPNAGHPVIDAEGRAVYSMDPLHFARSMVVLHEAGADILGGCCGTDPEYIRELVKAIR